MLTRKRGREEDHENSQLCHGDQKSDLWLSTGRNGAHRGIKLHFILCNEKPILLSVGETSPTENRGRRILLPFLSALQALTRKGMRSLDAEGGHEFALKFC